MSKVTPSRVNFNNVTSLGVSYQWSHGVKDGAPLPCTGITNQAGRETGKWIERIKTLDLEVANLDLSNNGGSVVAQMAAQQARYVNTSTHSIYTNGAYAGNGYLTSYSINEGSLSNASVTSLQYTMRDGGEDPNEANSSDDPVTRSESIKVSRDLKGKSYTINHSYSVGYGSDWDLVTDYPLYSGNPAYRSVVGRLTLAEQEAHAAVDNDITDYNQYIDLSAYTVGSGFNLEKINNGCSGVFTSSNSTKNFINGDFSYNKTTVLRYTGQDFDPELEPYEVAYTIGWNQAAQSQGENPCVELVFQGSIKANSVPDCSTGNGGAGAVAESGFKEWVAPDDPAVTPKGLTKVIEFFNAVSGSMALPGAKSYPLVEKILSYKKEECAPSVDKGGDNDGTINFEFKTSNCPENNADETQYLHSESTSISFSNGGCQGAERRITDISVDGSVEGQCGVNLTPSGVYQKWNAVSGVFDALRLSGLAKGPPLYNGSYSLRLASESQSISKYDGNASYAYSWTDSNRDQECGVTTRNGCSDKYAVSDKTTETPAKPRYVNTVTANGIVSEQKGESLPVKSSSISIAGTGEGIGLTVRTFLDEALCQGNLFAPSCVINELSVSMDKSWNNGTDEQKGSINVGGINS